MPRTQHTLLLTLLMFAASAPLVAQDDEKAILNNYRSAASKGGDASAGKKIFTSKEADCTKCHGIAGKKPLAGPDLAVIGDKYTRDQLIRSVLEPSAGIHPDYASQVIITSDGKTLTGVLQSRTAKDLRLLDAEGKLLRIPVADIEEQKRSKTSLMPTGLYKKIKPRQFADLVEYLGTLKQKEGIAYPGMPAKIATVAKPASVVPLHSKQMRFDHPVWIIAKPGTTNTYLVVEQQTRKIYQLTKNKDGDRKELFADLSHEAITGQFEGVLCQAFHPDFLNNRKFYLIYHVQ